MPCDEKQLSRALEVTDCSHSPFPGNIPNPVGIFNQLEVSLHTAKCQGTKCKGCKLAETFQAAPIGSTPHNEHKDFSLWHRKSFTKCWNNTDLISWLEFLGMLS